MKFSLENLKVEITDYGYRVVGWQESIRPLAQAARIKYKKKLRTKRLMKKYAKKLLTEAIDAFIEEAYAKQKENGTEHSQERGEGSL